MEKLSVLSPLKIKNQKQFDLFVRCLNTYKNIIQNENTEFLVVNESNKDFLDKVEKEILKIKPNYRNIKEVGFVNSVKKLIQESVGKYVMFFLDDVEMVYDSKKICETVIKSMEDNEKIFQIKLGGGKVGNSPKSVNINKFSKNHQKIVINEDFNVWLNETENEYNINIYVISQWNSIMRGKTIRELNKKMGKQDALNWDQFTVIMSREYRKEIKDTYTGWLNLQSFLYPWGRAPHQINKWKTLVSS